MAIGDIFKKKTEKETKSIEAKPEERQPKAAGVRVESHRKHQAKYGILRTPHITEKATDMSAKNKYVFNIDKNANKNEVKNDIENVYKVKVVSVNIINVPAKKRRLGKTKGWRPAYKKAIVEITEGEKIELVAK